jgi:hypothetical protein
LFLGREHLPLDRAQYLESCHAGKFSLHIVHPGLFSTATGCP